MSLANIDAVLQDLALQGILLPPEPLFPCCRSCCLGLQCRPTYVAAQVFGDGSVLPSFALLLHNLRGRPTTTPPQPHPTCRARWPGSSSPGQLLETGSFFHVNLCNRPSCQPLLQFTSSYLLRTSHIPHILGFECLPVLAPLSLQEAWSILIHAAFSSDCYTCSVFLIQ